MYVITKDKNTRINVCCSECIHRLGKICSKSPDTSRTVDFTGVQKNCIVIDPVEATKNDKHLKGKSEVSSKMIMMCSLIYPRSI